VSWLCSPGSHRILQWHFRDALHKSLAVVASSD
jgi:hypothetical protein